VSDQLGLDVTMNLNEIVQDSFRGEIVLSGGQLFLGRTAPPEVTLQADPFDLPFGIFAVEVGLNMDAGNVSYSGPATPARLGDSDLDDDVDLFDFAFFSMCVVDMTDVRCTLHDFDGDGDGELTVLDYAGFQRAFTGD
jgi:hypothetical protein